MPTAGEVVFTVLSALWIMLPAYIANMAPVVVGGGAPIDLGRTWKDGKPILGPGKTWRGLLLAPLVATVATFLLVLLVERTAWGDHGWPTWGPWPWWPIVVYAMGLGALVGDAVKSFFKRRTGRDRGAQWPLFDQLDFVVGGLLFAALAVAVLAAAGPYAGWGFLDHFTPARILVIVLLTPALHLLVNYLGYKLGLKEVPW